MSKYTTEVRFICETLSGYDESQGYNKVDEILGLCWNKIFDAQFPIFDEKYRAVLCMKILRHYYTREIGAETVGLWQLWLNTKMREIMPYYNKLYQSELLQFDPFNDVNLTRTHKRTTDGSSKEDVVGEKNGNGSSSTNSSTQQTNSGTSYDLYSETPQGSLSGVDNEEYLTNARKLNNNSNNRTSGDGSSRYSDAENTSNSKTGEVSTTEDYLETIIGKQGSGDYSTLMLKYRETFLNIDMLIIKELENLFFQLW